MEHVQAAGDRARSKRKPGSDPGERTGAGRLDPEPPSGMNLLRLITEGTACATPIGCQGSRRALLVTDDRKDNRAVLRRLHLRLDRELRALARGFHMRAIRDRLQRIELPT